MLLQVPTAIAGVVHTLYATFTSKNAWGTTPRSIFFLGSGIAQIFWIFNIIKRWGRIWYYIGIAGILAFIGLLYVITQLPGNPVNERGGDIDAIDMICELAQVAYIAMTPMIR